MSAPRDLFRIVGTTIAEKYRVDRVLGEGGFGVVYAGEHLLLSEKVAIKCMKPLGESTEDEARTTQLFLREAKVLFSLTHPGIVRLYDLGTIDHALRAVPYVVLELLDGRSLEEELEERVRRGQPFSATDLLVVFEPVLEALAFAHQSGIAHRDLKPSNVMLVRSPGGGRTAKIVDFGIARWIGEQKHSAGVTGFTPRYAAPEQWDASLGQPGVASDVFSLGLMIAEACTLSPALPGSTPGHLLGAVMSRGRRVDLATARPDLPPALDALIARATQVDVARRHPTAKELLADFREAFHESARTHRVDPSSDRGVSPLAQTASQPAPRLPSTPSTTAETGTVPASSLTADPIVSRSLQTTQRTSHVSLGIALASSVVALIALGGAYFWHRSESSGSNGAPSQNVSTPSPSSAASTPASASAPDPFAGATVDVTTTFAGDVYREEQLDAMRTASLAPVRRCYVDALGRHGELGGRLNLLVSIVYTGKVFSVVDLDEGVVDPELVDDRVLRACVADAAKLWTFPQNTKTADVVGVLFSFDLRRGGGTPAGTDAGAIPALGGEYRSISVLASKKDVFDEPTTLAQRGSRVIGDYPDGTMACHLDGARLLCTWVQTDSSGRGVLLLKPHGLLEGTWGYGPSDSDAGPWKLVPKTRP